MENILQEINRDCISFSRDEERRNNRILHAILGTFITKMKEKDLLFKFLFEGVFYGGSYYDGLKVGRPEEFDIDLLLKVPVSADPTLSTSNIPGFVHLQLADLTKWSKVVEAGAGQPAYNEFASWVDDKRYLCTHKILDWMKGLVQRTINDFRKNGDEAVVDNSEGRFEITFHDEGPAKTLTISGAGIEMDVDLVACFVFGPDKWPKNGFKPNPVRGKERFFIVPKKPKERENAPIPRYWRLSFQEQERVLIDNKGYLKPSVRLLKRLRDNLQCSCIASYYIKTVALHMADEQSADFWTKSLNHVFITLLKRFKVYIEAKKIPYYWNKNNNLLGGVNSVTLDNLNNRLRVVIRDIENKPETSCEYLGNKARSRRRNVFYGYKEESIPGINHSALIIFFIFIFLLEQPQVTASVIVIGSVLFVLYQTISTLCLIYENLTMDHYMLAAVSMTMAYFQVYPRSEIVLIYAFHATSLKIVAGILQKILSVWILFPAFVVLFHSAHVEERIFIIIFFCVMFATQRISSFFWELPMIKYVLMTIFAACLDEFKIHYALFMAKNNIL